MIMLIFVIKNIDNFNKTTMGLTKISFEVLFFKKLRISNPFLFFF